MKLSLLMLDDLVPVPGYVRAQGGLNTARENVFTFTDGWDIEHLGGGLFSVYRDGMEAPVTIGGYGFSFVPLVTTLVTETRRKRGKADFAT